MTQKYTLYDFLLNGSYSCEVAGEIDPQCSFEWDEGDEITEEGYEEFKNVLECPAEMLSNGNISLDTSHDETGELDYEICRFVDSLAGYCPDDDWHRWFNVGSNW